MGTDDLFKKRRKDRERKKHDFKNSGANSYLIVTEGECTEPFYFEGLKKLILQNTRGNIDVVRKPSIEICGEGIGTKKLVNEIEKIVNKSHNIYQNIWVVFDKDHFGDFDDAIDLAQKKGYKVAWSNKCFEYWLYLHFCSSNVDLDSETIEKKLHALFRQYHLGKGHYEKNYENIYELLDTYKKVDDFSGVDFAIRNAESRMKEFDSLNDRPSQYAPGTTVHLLVKELKKYIEE